MEGPRLWFLLSVGDAVSSADGGKGHSLLCGHPRVLGGGFAVPPGTAWRAGFIHSWGSEQGSSGLVQPCCPVPINPVPPI